MPSNHKVLYVQRTGIMCILFLECESFEQAHAFALHWSLVCSSALFVRAHDEAPSPKLATVYQLLTG